MQPLNVEEIRSGTKRATSGVSGIWFLAAPVIIVQAMGFYYTFLNIHTEIFVRKLGCGCASGFNTNVLTLVVSGVLLSLAGGSWWFGMCRLPRRWFWPLASGFLVLAFVFFRKFITCNQWM